MRKDVLDADEDSKERRRRLPHDLNRVHKVTLKNRRLIFKAPRFLIVRHMRTDDRVVDRRPSLRKVKVRVLSVDVRQREVLDPVETAGGRPAEEGQIRYALTWVVADGAV